jgi:hypothetical protein
MLFREGGDGLWLISQPMHAWVAGQLARAWGNDRFGEVTPRAAVCLGAEQHDLGWADWEQQPTVNPQTGRPYRFFELPTGEHVAIWRPASRQALTQGRYAALLVSLHVSGLYARHDYSKDTPAEGQAARTFLAAEQSFQSTLLTSLSADPATAATATPAVVERNRRLVAVWDRLSLALCGGAGAPLTVPSVPTAEGEASLTVQSIGEPAGVPASLGSVEHYRVSPWPFASATVTLTFEGRQVQPPFADDAALRSALETAPWRSQEIILSGGPA